MTSTNQRNRPSHDDQVLDVGGQSHHGPQQAGPVRRYGSADVALLYQLVAQHLPDRAPADGEKFRRDLPPEFARRVQVSGI